MTLMTLMEVAHCVEIVSHQLHERHESTPIREGGDRFALEDHPCQPHRSCNSRLLLIAHERSLFCENKVRVLSALRRITGALDFECFAAVGKFPALLRRTSGFVALEIETASSCEFQSFSVVFPR